MSNPRGPGFDQLGPPLVKRKSPTVRRIAIADDTPGDLDLLRKVLRSPTTEIFAATSGGELLRLLGMHGPLDLIVTDIQMPELEGLSVMSLARAEGLETPVLFITALARPGLEVTVARIRNSRLLHKPVDALTLRQAARDLMGPASLKWSSST
jgi:CheY-like chemotaxis protein